MTGKKLARQIGEFGGGSRRRRKVRPHVLRAARRSFLMSAMAIAVVLAVYCCFYVPR
ncbi:hypothetical protein MKK69_23110 [Methylobacterium sp. J-026]|jgi:hypothetical protein|uniref:hypothetical protein n=1 Tax=unclassified Methylobacterium TaxID=2615210 RepID=UPI0016502C9C|nr:MULTISPECIES: hypothetical protein [unclassified Methylobacterium]MCJ2136904.1 hypothetical protein [Methylobacterium sp. J-026]